MDDTESSKETLGSTQMGTGTTISSDSSQQAAKTMSGAQVYKQVQLYKENAVLQCCIAAQAAGLGTRSPAQQEPLMSSVFLHSAQMLPVTQDQMFPIFLPMAAT